MDLLVAMLLRVQNHPNSSQKTLPIGKAQSLVMLHFRCPLRRRANPQEGGSGSATYTYHEGDLLHRDPYAFRVKTRVPIEEVMHNLDIVARSLEELGIELSMNGRSCKVELRIRQPVIASAFQYLYSNYSLE